MTYRPGRAVPLRRGTLDALPEGVRRPAYDPAAVGLGIVHLGLGNFHRAHMARYLHDLMETDPAARAWGVLGVGLRASDTPLVEALQAQDRLYTLCERGRGQETHTVVGALSGALVASCGNAPLLAVLSDPDVAIVSLTVTENGYGLSPATKMLDPADPDIAADLATPDRPRSAIGVLVEGLARRRAAGLTPFSALSCDNIQHNGDVLRAAVLAFADRREPALARWIETHAAFPNSMVDRITPATTPDDINALADLGLQDRCPVVCEPFRQWVIEDRFPAGRPALEAVGVQFVADVRPYEAMKLRLLNASHLAIAALGQLAGFTYVDETLADPLFHGLMRRLMDEETGPTLAPVPGIDLAAYKQALLARFGDTGIRDTLGRINDDAPLNYLLDPLRDRLARGQTSPLLTLAVAAWMRRLGGRDDLGRPIAVRHPLADDLQARAAQSPSDPRPLLAFHSLFGDLCDHARFVGDATTALEALTTHGARAALKDALRTHA